MLGFIASWLTPAILFCLLNLVIATIFLSSHSKPHKNLEPDPTHPLARSPSLIERVRAFKFNHYNPDLTNDHDPTHDLARAPSLLERVRSINFNLHNTDNSCSVPHDHDPARAPSLLERVRSINFNLHNTDNSYSNPPDHDPAPDPARPPSLLERVRSFNFSPFNAEQPDPETRNENPARLTRTPFMLERVWFKLPLHRSDSEGTDTRRPDPGSEEASAASSVRMRKSVSEKLKEKETEGSPELRRPATTRERKAAALGEDEGVDEKAGDFINKFRQQLKLQRLDSLLRYKEMLNRGTDH